VTRQEKYPETSTFHFHNANPKNRITTDCVIRAIATALDKPYNDIAMEMAQMQCETGYDVGDKMLYDKYLQSKGWIKHKQPRKYDNTKYTGKEFCEKIANKYSRYVANIGGNHIVAIVEGKVYDIWDSTYKCIGNYWSYSSPNGKD